MIKKKLKKVNQKINDKFFEINKKISNVKKYFSKKNIQNFEEIIAPCVGDIVEYEDGSRKIVASVDIENDIYLVRFLIGPKRTTDAKGRSFWVPQLSSQPEKWPPTNVTILRDSSVLYPQFEWKLDLIIWLSNKVLKN